MTTCRIVESWLAAHLKRTLPRITETLRTISFGCPRLLDWHVVRQFGHAFFGKEPRDQDVRVWQIHLTYPHIRQLGTNFESPALLIVEKSSEDGGRIEIRVAQESRSSRSYQPARSTACFRSHRNFRLVQRPCDPFFAGD